MPNYALMKNGLDDCSGLIRWSLLRSSKIIGVKVKRANGSQEIGRMELGLQQ
jgi:hypothetical protein